MKQTVTDATKALEPMLAASICIAFAECEIMDLDYGGAAEYVDMCRQRIVELKDEVKHLRCALENVRKAVNLTNY